MANMFVFLPGYFNSITTIYAPEIWPKIHRCWPPHPPLVLGVEVAPVVIWSYFKEAGVTRGEGGRWEY